MASKIIIRLLFIAALVVTAHTIKPFSLGNVSTQALGVAQSFSFVLPDSIAKPIKHAHSLAQLYGKGLFDETSSEWIKQNFVPSNLVAASNFVEVNDDAEIKDVKPGDLNRKSAPKRPVKRIKRDDSRDEDSGCSKNSELTHLPEVRTFKAVALVQPSAATMTYQLMLISKPASLMLQCNETKSVNSDWIAAPVEIVIGPDEEAEQTEQTETMTEQEATVLPEPKAPRIPECIRIP